MHVASFWGRLIARDPLLTGITVSVYQALSYCLLGSDLHVVLSLKMFLF